MGTLVPDVILVKMKQIYETEVIAQTGATTISLRGNDISDPEGSAGAAFPIGYDQWAAFYARFYVGASKCTTTFTSTDTTALWELIQQPSITQGFVGVAEEQPYVRSIIGGTRDSGTNHRRIKQYMTTNKMMGRKCVDESNFIGTIDDASPGSPASLWYWNIRLGPKTTAGSLDGIQRSIIVYYVKLFARVQVPESS